MHTGKIPPGAIAGSYYIDTIHSMLYHIVKGRTAW